MPKPTKEEPLFQTVTYETHNASIRFTEIGTMMLLIQTPSEANEGMVLRNNEILKLHRLLSTIIGRT
jgi:hypothetical protein